MSVQITPIIHSVSFKRFLHVENFRLVSNAKSISHGKLIPSLKTRLIFADLVSDIIPVSGLLQ